MNSAGFADGIYDHEIISVIQNPDGTVDVIGVVSDTGEKFVIRCAYDSCETVEWESHKNGIGKGKTINKHHMYRERLLENIDIVDLSIKDKGKDCDILFQAKTRKIFDTNIINKFTSKINKVINKFGQGGVTDIKVKGNHLEVSLSAPEALCDITKDKAKNILPNVKN